MKSAWLLQWLFLFSCCFCRITDLILHVLLLVHCALFPKVLTLPRHLFTALCDFFFTISRTLHFLSLRHSANFGRSRLVILSTSKWFVAIFRFCSSTSFSPLNHISLSAITEGFQSSNKTSRSPKFADTDPVLLSKNVNPPPHYFQRFRSRLPNWQPILRLKGMSDFFIHYLA